MSHVTLSLCFCCVYFQLWCIIAFIDDTIQDLIVIVISIEVDLNLVLLINFTVVLSQHIS